MELYVRNGKRMDILAHVMDFLLRKSDFSEGKIGFAENGGWKKNEFSKWLKNILFCKINVVLTAAKAEGN